MEPLGLRRTQSLKSISGVQERSWAMPDPRRWERKSVFEMVRHYQSCTDLRDLERVELRKSSEIREDRKTWQTKKSSKSKEDRENVPQWGSGRNTCLYRSRSMDFHPQRESAGTKALCALFESKAAQEAGPSSTATSPTRYSAAAPTSRRDKECPLQDWRGHSNLLRDMTDQKTTLADRGRAANGLPHTFQAGSKHSFDDKCDTLPTKQGISSRPTRDSISSSPSVRDRSALYLSITAAINSTGGPPPPEFFDTPKTKAKSRKFQLPANEMCSACLTPVYPMEKMVANKLILHNKCFFCKHCKKKLSIHNFSSLNGEFYCVSHYEQLLKRKGNYDEGFGINKRKDQWIHKSKGTDEMDSISTPKVKKSSLNTSNNFKEYSTVVEKTPTKELQSSHGAESTGKLKMSWPPEKDSGRLKTVQQTHLKNSISEIKRASAHNQSAAANNTPQLGHGVEVKDKVKALTSSFSLGDAKKSKMAHPNFTAEKPSNEGSKPKRDTSFPTLDRATTVTNHKKELKNVCDSNSHIDLTSTSVDLDTSKAKKFVHFARDTNAGKHSPSSKLTVERETEEQKGRQNIQFKSRNLRDAWYKKDKLSAGTGNELRQSKTHTETPETKLHEQTTNTPFKESECKVKNDKEIRKTDTVIENRGREKEDLNQSFSDSNNKVLNQQKTQDHVKAAETKHPSALHGSAAETDGQKTNSVSNHLKKAESDNAQGNGGSQRRLQTTANPVKVSANPEEKPNVKVGTRSGGISALSKLFTSSGNGNKTEPKDGKKPDPKKPGGGLLGRLLHSSDKETTKNAKQNAKKDKTETDVKKMDESWEDTSKEAPLRDQEPGKKLIDQSQVQPQKQETIQQIGEQLKVSTLKQDNELKTDEISHALPQESKTSEQLPMMSQTPPPKQPAKEELSENPQELSWEEQPVEESMVPSLELDSSQQMVEMIEAQPKESIEQMSLLSPLQDREVEDPTVELTLEPSQGEELMKQTAESTAPDSDTDVSEPSSVPGSPICEMPNRSLIEQTNKHLQTDYESNLQFTKVADHCVAEGGNTVPVQDQGPEESDDESGQDGLGIQLNDDTLKRNETSGFVDPEANLKLCDEFHGKRGELLDAPVTESAELFINPNHKPLEQSSNNLGLLESEETTVDMFSSALSGHAFSKNFTGGAFDLLSPKASKNEVSLGMMDELMAPSHQDEIQSPSSFDISDQAGEETENGSENALGLDMMDELVAPSHQNEIQSPSSFDISGQAGEETKNRSENGLGLDMMDELVAPSHQDEIQSPSSFGTSDQAGEETENGSDFDIFGSNNTLLNQSPSIDVTREAGDPTNQSSSFTEDILGNAFSSSQDVSISAPSDPSTSNSLSDPFGPDMSFNASSSVQVDLFTDDFFRSAPQLLPVSQSSDMDLFMDGLLASDNSSSTMKAAENAASSNSWMDDLLG